MNIHKVFFCLGNHDKAKSLVDIGLANTILDFQRKIKVHNISLILLDTSTGVILQNQLNWLSENIDSNGVNLIFTHYPILESGLTQFDEELGIKNRNLILSLLFSRKNNLFIFSGHYHRFDFYKCNGITQVICPSAIMQIKEQNKEIKTDSFKFGYNIIDIQDNEIELETVYFKGYGKDNPW